MDETIRAAVREAFARVEEAPPEARPSLLETFSPPVRHEVESLLNALQNGDGWFLPDDELHSGARVGQFVLCEVLGQGGMGVVYRAERHDGEYNAEVAVKIASGRLLAPDAQRRFIRERLILAQLDHPNIVRLLDGGVLCGQRYMVMELVRGAPINVYARDLGVRDRLMLFRQVCSAVGCAHQKLLLHRDLKAGNILVREDGLVKVLDFGVAQLLLQDDSSETALHPLSLSCASPEQMRGEPLLVASDIYALGVLLYELVTGENPQYREGDRFPQVFARVTGDTATPPSKLAKGIRPDLDAIVAKAMAKEPNERYSSVAELDADVGCYLSLKPVTAIRPSPMYLAKALIRRHRALTAFVSVVLIAAVVGLAAYIRETRRDARRFAEARRLVRTVLFDIQPKLNSIPATLDLRKALIEEALRYLEAVSRDAGGDTDLLLEIGRGYLELGQFQANGNGSGLSDTIRAERSYDAARVMIDRAVRSSPDNSEVLMAAAGVHSHSATFFGMQGRLGDQQSEANLAAGFGKRALDLRPDDPRSKEAYALALFARGGALEQSDWKRAIDNYAKAGLVYADLAREFSKHRRNVGLMERYITSLLLEHELESDALGHAQRALTISETRWTAEPSSVETQFDYAIDLSQMGSVIGDTAGSSKALPYRRKSLEIREQIVARDPENAQARQQLAVAAFLYAADLRACGELQRSRSILAQSIETYSLLAKKNQLLPAAEPYFARALKVAGQVETELGRHEVACGFYDRAENVYSAVAARNSLTERAIADRAEILSLRTGCVAARSRKD